jgi:hypothetical protein
MSIKCHRCVHLSQNPVSKNYSCKKNWFGGCSEPCAYSAKICAQKKKDFEPKKTA